MTTPATPGGAEYDQMRARWEKEYRPGQPNAHRVQVLERDRHGRLRPWNRPLRRRFAVRFGVARVHVGLAVWRLRRVGK